MEIFTDGLDYNVCYDPTDPECHGGDNEADHVSQRQGPFLACA